MKHSEIANEIATEIPEIKTEISRAMNLKNPFTLIRIITRHTRKMVEQHNDLRTEKCLKLLDRMYTNGDIMIKRAIENVFIFSLDSIVSSCTSIERNHVFNKIPVSLYTVYNKQVYKSGM